MENDAIIRFEQVTKIYGDNRALDDFNLAIRKGEFLTVIGSSGSGSGWESRGRWLRVRTFC